jgi:hypothetical protein
MDDLEGTVAEIDDIAMRQQAAGWRRQNAVARRVPAFRYAVEHLVIRIAVSDGPFIARIGENFGLGRVHAAVRKFVVTTDMVEMRVAGDANELPLAHQHVMPEAEMAKPGVEEKITLAAAHVPDVAAEERLDPRLMDQRHTVAHTDGLVPVWSVDDRKSAHFSP